MDVKRFDAYQHWFWRQTEQFGPLTTGCGRLRGDTPLVVCLNFQGSKSNNVVADDGKAYSLNAMHGHDMHVVCFQSCGDRDNPSVSVSDTAYCIPANPMSDRVQAVCFSIGSMNSKGMLSDNPHAGIHETTVARTIDANGSNPAGYQGGDVVVMENYTGGGIAATLDASYWKGAGARNGKEREFICILRQEVHSQKTDTD